MPYLLQPTDLDLTSNVHHQCYLHYTRDQHLIGVIKFNKPHGELTWFDIEYCRRQMDHFAMMSFPDVIQALIIDLTDFCPLLDQDSLLVPWRLYEQECPLRLVVHPDQFHSYTAIFDATLLTTSTHTAIQEIREFMDMFVH